MTIDKDHPHEVVKKQYEELMENGMPFLQIFPEMIQELTVAETFKNRTKARNKSITQSRLDDKSASIEEFRENLFLYCGISLNIFNLSSQTQAAFWFMLFNWIECNNYSITIGPEKRKTLALYYSRSNDPNSRSVQNIFRALTKSGLLVKCKKTDSICKNNKTYETTYRVPFIVSQQRLNKKFIMMNNEVIQLRSELLARSKNYLIKKENNNTTSEGVENAIDHVFNDVISKVSKRNIEALGRVEFSARIDFSIDGGLKIAEIERIENIESRQPLEYTNELTKIFNSIRLTKKQKELLQSNYLSLRETYFLQGKTAFNSEFKSIAGLGRSTRKVLIEFFEEFKTELLA
jgi:hypothetical protein